MNTGGFESFESLLHYLYRLQRLGIKTGLEHSRKLLEACGNPEKELKIIHIAGTNGKGSVSASIASILRTAGYKTGLYTSPHLIKFNERIRVNGNPISDADIVQFISRYKNDIDRIEATFFETTTALALKYFQQSKTDICIVETGLGGRLDSTNVITPELTVITPVDLDHAEYLGDTIEKIAFEKAGIIKKDIPLVLAPQDQGARGVIMKKSEEMNSPVTEISLDAIERVGCDRDGTKFTYKGEEYKTPLIGSHQAYNAALAISSVRLFDRNIEPAVIRKGLFGVSWPGRLQLLQANPPVFYDVAHNPHGIEAVLGTLKELGFKKISGVIAIKGDKSLDEIGESIRNRFSELHTLSVEENDLIEAGKLAQTLKNMNIDSVDGSLDATPLAGFLDSLDRADAGLIFGSHYIAEIVFRVFDFSFDNGGI